MRLACNEFKSNNRDTNLYTNLCTKITRGNIHSYDDNTRGNNGNTRSRLCKLKLNYMDCDMRFGAIVGVPSIIDGVNAFGINVHIFPNTILSYCILKI